MALPRLYPYLGNYRVTSISHAWTWASDSAMSTRSHWVKASLFSSLSHIVVSSRTTGHFRLLPQYPSIFLRLQPIADDVNILWMDRQSRLSSNSSSLTVSHWPSGHGKHALAYRQDFHLPIPLRLSKSFLLFIPQGSSYQTCPRLLQPYRVYLPLWLFNFVSAIALKQITTMTLRQCRSLQTLLS